MSIKRIAAVAVLGIAAVAGMSACRVESGAALFVQGTRVEESRVNDIAEAAPKVLPPTPASPRPQELSAGMARQLTVSWLTAVELAKKVSAHTHVPLPGPDYATASQVVGGDDKNAFTRLYAEYTAYRPVLFTGSAPVEPTEADKQAFGDSISQQFGQVPSDLDEAIATELPRLSQVLGEQKQLESLFAEYDAFTNPRYGQIVVSTESFNVLQSNITYSLAASVPSGSPA